jgi:hypothetical protein
MEEQDEESSVCALCIEDLSGDSNHVITLSCGHRFHRLCAWDLVLYRRNADVFCPLCRNGPLSRSEFGAIPREIISRFRIHVHTLETQETRDFIARTICFPLLIFIGIFLAIGVFILILNRFSNNYMARP